MLQLPVFDPVRSIERFYCEELLPDGWGHRPGHEITVVASPVSDQVWKPQLPRGAGMILQAVMTFLNL